MGKHLLNRFRHKGIYIGTFDKTVARRLRSTSSKVCNCLHGFLGSLYNGKCLANGIRRWVSPQSRRLQSRRTAIVLRREQNNYVERNHILRQRISRLVRKTLLKRKRIVWGHQVDIGALLLPLCLSKQHLKKRKTK